MAYGDTASGERMPSQQNRPATLSEQLANSRQSPSEVTPNSDGPAESNLASNQASEQAFVQVAFQDNNPGSPSSIAPPAKLAQQPGDAPPVAPPLPTIPGKATPLPGSGDQGVISPALPAEQIPEEISPGVDAAPLNQRVVTLEDVLSSVENHVPLLIAAAAEQQVADGKLLAAQGALGGFCCATLEKTSSRKLRRNVIFFIGEKELELLN